MTSHSVMCRTANFNLIITVPGNGYIGRILLLVTIIQPRLKSQ